MDTTLPTDDLSVQERFIQLNTKQVMQLIGTKNRSTVWKYVKEGKLPKPRYISKHRPLWRLAEVVETFEQHLQPYDAEARAFRGDEGLEEIAPAQVKTSAAAKIRERLGLRR